MDRDFLDFTSPRPMGRAAGEGTFLAGEIIEPGASILSSRPFQTVWVVATLLIRPDPAFMNTVVAPFQFA